MAKWYVKDLSKLTGISVQTLHHYDRIDLLKPTSRLESGYRLYSEKDLLKLQQIIALKFFGFELSQIKTLLAGNVNAVEHFSAQARFLAEKAKALFEASNTLKEIIGEYSNKSIQWESIIKLIEVYQMTQRLEKTWAGKVLTPEELKQYANFESDLKIRFTPQDKKAFDDTWAMLVSKIGTNLDKDPKSDLGSDLARQVMDLINGLYGKEHADLRHSIWHKGYKTGQMNGEHSLSPEIVTWLDKAMDGYYRKRIYNILDQAEQNSSSDLSLQWECLMDEMFGESKILKQEVIDAAMTDNRVGITARKWLQQFIG